MKVTFLGLGIMGSRMARHLIDRGFDLTVWNRSSEPQNALERAGARGAASPEAAVAGADLVITMLSTPEVVRSVVLETGLLGAMKTGAI